MVYSLLIASSTEMGVQILLRVEKVKPGCALDAVRALRRGRIWDAPRATAVVSHRLVAPGDNMRA